MTEEEDEDVRGRGGWCLDNHAYSQLKGCPAVDFRCGYSTYTDAEPYTIEESTRHGVPTKGVGMMRFHLTLDLTKRELCNISCLAYSPDGKTMVIGAKLWDSATGEERATLDCTPYTFSSVAFSPDGHTLASGSAKKKVLLWDVASGQRRSIWYPRCGVRSLAFSPDGKTLATGNSDGTVTLRDAVGSQELITLPCHTDIVYSVAFSPDGKTLATGSRDKRVKLWDAATAQERTALGGHTKSVWSVAFSSDGKTLATGGEDSTVKLWDAANAQALAALHGRTGGVRSVAFSPDSKTLATGNSNGTVTLWDAAGSQQPITLPDYPGPVYSVAFSPDGKTLATGSREGTLKWSTLLDLEADLAATADHAVGRGSDTLGVFLDRLEENGLLEGRVWLRKSGVQLFRLEAPDRRNPLLYWTTTP
jgi:tricorn protease-like protein